MAHLLLQDEINSGTPTTPRGSKLDSSNWIEVQHVTFTQWVNVQLRKESVIVEGLTSAFTDGVNLCYLLDQLKSKVQVKKKKKKKHQDKSAAETTIITLASKMNKKPKIPIQMIENINLALNSMTESGINLTGITSDEINKGNLKICLALVWRMILFYQINSDDQSDVMESPNKGKVSVEKSMLGWVQDIISEYTEKYGFSVSDISSSWSDGKALGAVIDRLMKEKFRNDLEEMFKYFNYERDVINTTKSKSEINEHLVNVANDQLEIPDLINSNILEKGPEKLSMLTYLSYFKEKGEELIPSAGGEEGTPISNPVSPKSPQSPRSPRSPIILINEPPVYLSDTPELRIHDASTCPFCSEASELKVQLEMKVTECSKLEIDISEKRQQLEGIEQTLKELNENSQQKLSTLNEEKQTIAKELKTLQEELSKTTKLLEQDKEETEKIRESEQILKTNLEAVQSELNSSNTVVDELRKEVERLNIAEAELKEKLEKREQESNLESDEQISSLHTQLESLKENQDETKKQLEKEQLEKQALQEKLEQLQKEMASNVEKHTESLQQVGTQLEEAKKNLEESLNKYDNEKQHVERLQSSNKDLSVNIETLTNEKLDIENKLKEEIEKNQSLTKLNESLKNASNNSESQLQENLKNLEENLKKQKKEKEDLEKKIENLSKEHEKSLSGLREEKHQVDLKLKECEKELSHSKQLASQTSTLTQQVESLQKELANQKVLNESLTKSEKEKIQEISNSASKQTQSLKEEITKEKQTSQQLSHSLESEKNQNMNLRNEIDQLSQQFNSLKINHEKERREKESIKNSLDKALVSLNSYEEKLKSLQEQVENNIVLADEQSVENKEEDIDLNPIDTTPRNQREATTNMIYYFFAVLGVSFLLELSK